MTWTRGIRALAIATAVVLVVGTVTVEIHHRLQFGHWIGYGWHVDLLPEQTNSGIPGVEHLKYAEVTNFTLLPSSVETCLIPNDVKPYQTPFYPFRIQVSKTAAGDWQTVRPDLKLECPRSNTVRQTIWPLRSFNTEGTATVVMSMVRKGSWIRLMMFSSFDNQPGTRKTFLSPAFHYPSGTYSGVEATVCELSKLPERFNGQLVKIKGNVQKGYELSLVVDDSCGAKIWLETLDSGAVMDRDYWEMQDLLFEADHTTAATLIGRFEHRSKVRAMRLPGFGHLGYWDSQLVLQSVSDVVTQKLDR